MMTRAYLDNVAKAELAQYRKRHLPHKGYKLAMVPWFIYMHNGKLLLGVQIENPAGWVEQVSTELDLDSHKKRAQ